MNTKAEKRQFGRFLFPKESNVAAELNLFDNDNTSLLADIIDLSEEGLGLNFRATLPLSLCEGDWIILKQIEGLPELKFLTGLEMKLKWIMSYNRSRGTRFGCVFTNISPAVKEKIREFINTQIDEKLTHTKGTISKVST